MSTKKSTAKNNKVLGAVVKLKKGSQKRVNEAMSTLPPIGHAEKGESRTFTLGGVVFEVTAIIPTQMYGNIQPRIQVCVNTVEEGRAMVMPMIEDLYRTYGEAPVNGKPIKFLGNIVETVKDLSEAPSTVITAPSALSQSATTAATTAAPEATAQAPKEKSPAVQKAEKALSLAMSLDAVIIIQDQIEKSTKIDQADKPELLTLCLKRRNELK